MIYTPDDDGVTVLLAEGRKPVHGARYIDTEKRVIERYILDPYNPGHYAVGSEGLLVVVEEYPEGKYEVWQTLNET